MRRISLALGVFGLWAGVAQAQSFDVASVKPHPASGDNRIMVRIGGGPGTPDPGRLNYENVTLKDVLTKAFDVKSYQLTTPEWTGSERFDITAKVPDGTSKEQFRVMLQNLMAERFKMTFHREKKELPAYALVVSKGGPKMKVSEEPPAGEKKDDPPPPPGAMRAMQMGKDGFPVAPKGRGNFMMMMPGKARLVANGAPVSQLIDMISNQVDRPVVDATELKGKYDFTLEFLPEMRNMPGGPMMMGRGPGEGGGGQPPEGEAAPSLFTALQEQLGLKLEPKREPIELVVIDHVERTPTEN